MPDILLLAMVAGAAVWGWVRLDPRYSDLARHRPQAPTSDPLTDPANPLYASRHGHHDPE